MGKISPGHVPQFIPSPTSRTALPGDRDLDILHHVMRYRLTTPEVLHRLFFAESDRNAVTKVTSRLCDRDYLQSHPLYASYTYFTLGKQGAKLTGLATKKVGPLGPQSLYREFGTLAFCCLADPPREKFRVREIATKFPQLLARGMNSSHYYTDYEITPTGTIDRLGLIWVEGGGAIDHIVRTVRDELIESRRGIPMLQPLFDSHRFVVAVVTCSPEKKIEIQMALRQIPTPILFRVEAVPELIHLLPGARHG